MYCLDCTLPTVAENLALDEALLLNAEAEGREWLRLWEWQSPAVVLGSACRIASDVDQKACRVDGVPIRRRSSGGGTVLLGKGCLLYSLVLSYEHNPVLRHIKDSYQFILRKLQDAIKGLGPEVSQAGSSDLAINRLKFSGNSQQRKLNYLLHHGTILYAFDVSLVSRYLLMPERQPKYRQHRQHHEFLTNLAVEPESIRAALTSTWQPCEFTDSWPVEEVQRLRTKYENQEWTYRR
jgi:lipoate-protein ligase A